MREYYYSVGKGWSRMVDRNVEDIGDWIEGSVLTPFGVVLAFSQGDKRNFHHTNLEFVRNGKCHVRCFDKRYTKRGVARLAKQFAEDIVRKAPIK